MRIVLIYPPPWKIAAPGEPPYPAPEGPYTGCENASLSGDFIEAPYGMLSLAAQAMRAGHDVTPLNLSTFEWTEVERIVASLDADLFGISSFTATRRGTLLVAELIKRLHPGVHVSVGGPHATGLPLELLERCVAIDSVCVGEGEQTFDELIGRLERGEKLGGIPGLAVRSPLGVRYIAGRERIGHLDELVDYHEYWPHSPFAITSRGCPGKCTYCGSNATWGVRLKFHSVQYTLDMLERIVRSGQRLIAIKDDTFTSDRRRAHAICEGIRERGLDLLWTCDTRIDALDEEILEAMRRAGCQRLSLGIESASPTILENIKKRVKPEKIIEMTRAAQRFGFGIRYYMMVGNRGETWETFQESLRCIEEARPNQYLFSSLAIYPGTEEWEIFKRDHGVTADFFFEGDFWKPIVFPTMPREDAMKVVEWLRAHPGIVDLHDYTVEELRAVVARLPDTAAAYMDLAGACVREGRFAEARANIERATELRYAMPEIGDNYLACMAMAEGDHDAARAHLSKAARGYPHRHIMENAEAFDAWWAAGEGRGPLELRSHGDLDLAVELRQPNNPGPVDTLDLPAPSREASSAA